MNNFESEKDLIWTAKRIMERDLQKALEDKDDNMVVRRAGSCRTNPKRNIKNSWY